MGIVSSRWDLPGITPIPSALVILEFLGNAWPPRGFPLHPLCLRLDPGSPGCPGNLGYQEFHAGCPKIPRKIFITFKNIFINTGVNFPLIFWLFSLLLFPSFPK